MKNFNLYLTLAFFGLCSFFEALHLLENFLIFFDVRMMGLEFTRGLLQSFVGFLYIPSFMLLLLVDNHKWKTKLLFYIAHPFLSMMGTKLHFYALEGSAGIELLLNNFRVPSDGTHTTLALIGIIFISIISLSFSIYLFLMTKNELKAKIPAPEASGLVFVGKFFMALTLPGILLATSGLYILTFIPEGVSLLTKDFLRLENLKLISVERRYEKDGVEVRLLPMAHIGNKKFYNEVLFSFPRQKTAVLIEGVKDEEKKIKLDHSKLAKELNLNNQKDEFDPAKYVEDNRMQDYISIVWADVDASAFNSETVKLLNKSSLDSIKGITDLLNAGFGPDDLKNLFADILEKRNAKLIEVLEEQAKEVEVVIIPWGALHMEGVEDHLLKTGYNKLPTLSSRVIFNIMDIFLTPVEDVSEDLE